MSSGAKRNRDISDFKGRLRFLTALGMTLGLGEIFNAQVLIKCISTVMPISASPLLYKDYFLTSDRASSSPVVD